MDVPSLPLSSKPLMHSSLVLTSLFSILCLLCPHIDALNFTFPSFEPNPTNIELEGDAHYMSTSIYLSSPIKNSVGRALYSEPMQLWDIDGNTKRLADFTANFSFTISEVAGFGVKEGGHGLAFVLIRENSTFSNNSIGGWLGLFETDDDAKDSNGRTNYVVAVEFDTYQNTWDDSINHVGIDVNSLRSKKSVNVPNGFINRGPANVQVIYNSTTKNLSALLGFSASGSSTYYGVSHIIDLSTVLPQRVRVGFTAATRAYVETRELNYWSFKSTIGGTSDTPPSSPQGPPSSPSGGNKVGLVVGATAGLFVIILISGVALCWFRSKRYETQSVKSPVVPPLDQQETAQIPIIGYQSPKRFSYLELSKATNNFDKELKLGEGGFGDVYQGKLEDSNEKVAVKRFRGGSSQGEKEYVSEVSVISTLKHKNMVQLKGWCHDNKELILVYEFMPNRSLDFHLFGKNVPPLTWAQRYKIIVDLSSALHYLQDGCDPFVLHRDIKSSNIMLDSNFHSKLGDFGLARFTTQDQSFKTTVPAGTLGYLAPEVILRGKISKASNIYSFGVVALEIASGRRSGNQSKEDPITLNLVEWVWDLYGKQSILEGVDVKLNGEFNHNQARRMLVVGLWCCNPDPDHRPSIRQVQAALNFEAAEPNLPPTIPRPTYVSYDRNPSLLSSIASTDTEAQSSSTVSHIYNSSSSTI